MSAGITRWQGMNGEYGLDATAVPTALGPDPIAFAIEPYVVTFPVGILWSTWYTFCWKLETFRKSISIFREGSFPL